jgi:hypothetical protein
MGRGTPWYHHRRSNAPRPTNRDVAGEGWGRMGEIGCTTVATGLRKVVNSQGESA